MYTEKVMEHFKYPRNMGEIPDADGVGTVGNPVCGDMMSIYIKVKEGRISDIKFKTYGCGAAIATSSMITELAKGKTLDEALKITRGDVANALEGLPPVKMHCSNLAADALHAAVEDYRGKASGKVKREATTTEINRCEYCKREIPPEECALATYCTTVDGKEYTFCCSQCGQQFQREKTRG
jgi:nitrogen fixation NifU-like protein